MNKYGTIPSSIKLNKIKKTSEQINNTTTNNNNNNQQLADKNTDVPEFQRVFTHLRKVQQKTNTNSNNSDMDSTSTSSASDSSQDSRTQMISPINNNIQKNNSNNQNTSHFMSHTINRQQRLFPKTIASSTPLNNVLKNSQTSTTLDGY